MLGETCVLFNKISGTGHCSCGLSRVLVLATLLLEVCTIAHSAPAYLRIFEEEQQGLEELDRLSFGAQDYSAPHRHTKHHHSKPIKMHNFLGNILAQSENNRVASQTAAAAWQMDRTAQDELPAITHRISQDSFSAAIKKILMGIH